MVVDFLAQRPDLVTPRWIAADVTAELNAGQIYRFDAGAVVYPDPLFRAIAGAWYLVDNLSWRLLGVPEDVYAGATAYIPSVQGMLRARLYWPGAQGTSLPLIPLVQYYDAYPLRIWTLPPGGRADAPLSIEVTGGINTVGWVGPVPNTLTARLVFRVFEIRDRAFVDRLNQGGIGGLGLPD